MEIIKKQPLAAPDKPVIFKRINNGLRGRPAFGNRNGPPITDTPLSRPAPVDMLSLVIIGEQIDGYPIGVITAHSSPADGAPVIPADAFKIAEIFPYPRVAGGGIADCSLNARQGIE